MSEQRLQTFPLPDVGEGLTEAEILEWKVAEGDLLEVNQIMVEIETAKAAVELPSPHAGRVHRLLAEPGVTLEVGTPIIEIDTQPDAGPLEGGGGSGGGAGVGDGAGAAGGSGYDDAAGAGPGGSGGAASDAGGTAADRATDVEVAGADAGAKIGEVGSDGRVATLVGYIEADSGSGRRRRHAAVRASAGAASAGETSVSPVAGAAGGAAESAAGASGAARGAALRMAPLATPPVRKHAKDLGIDLYDVIPSRADGVISREDVETAAAGASVSAGSSFDGVTGAAAGARTRPDYDPATRERREAIRGVRRATAAAMVESAFTAPHVTEFLTIDVTPMMELRERLRRRPEWSDVKLSPLAFAARAVCLAVRRTPAANCVLDPDTNEIVYKEYVHLGIAAATDRGLVVPVIRDADGLDLHGLAGAIGELAATARAGRTPPADMLGGTFSITNVGVFGVDTGTPIIPPGQSAILALGSIKDAPWVVDGELAVRKVCSLALSFDHRVIDGQQGSEFLADVGALLADPALAITF